MSTTKSKPIVPAGFRLLGRQWTIQMVPDYFDSPSIGTNHRQKGEIYVGEGQSPVELLDTVLHEIIHSITWLMGLGNHQDEELFVRLIATGLVGVLQDNPALAEWLLEPR